MNYFQKKAKKNLNRFVDEKIVATLIKPRKKSKMYQRKDGRLITHRAVMKIIRNIMKKRNEDILNTIDIRNGRTIKHRYKINQHITILKTGNYIIGGILTKINDDNIIIKKDDIYIQIYFKDIEKIIAPK